MAKPWKPFFGATANGAQNLATPPYPSARRKSMKFLDPGKKKTSFSDTWWYKGTHVHTGNICDLAEDGLLALGDAHHHDCGVGGKPGPSQKKSQSVLKLGYKMGIILEGYDTWQVLYRDSALTTIAFKWELSWMKVIRSNCMKSASNGFSPFQEQLQRNPWLLCCPRNREMLRQEKRGFPGHPGPTYELKYFRIRQIFGIQFSENNSKPDSRYFLAASCCFLAE